MRKKLLLIIISVVLGISIFSIVYLNKEKRIERLFEKICNVSEEEYMKYERLITAAEKNVSYQLGEMLYDEYKSYLTREGVDSLIQSGILTLGFHQHQYGKELNIESLNIKKIIGGKNNSTYYEYKIIWMLSGEKISGSGNIYFSEQYPFKIENIVRIE